MSQKNVNKFLAGAVTATMVATAVVTPAMAASFTDTGKLPAQIKGEVDRAVELGYFQDSEKFNPAASITRGQVALVIARQVSGVAANDIAGLKAYVAKHGLEEKVTPFADVKKGETELYYASLIVKNAGAFTQDSLNPASNITRSQMAKVVVTAFDLKMNEDNKKEITDIDKISNKEYIEILASNGVTEPQNGKFNPGNNVTRSQMASFLVRAHDGVKEEVKEAKIESVKAINSTTVEVKFNKAVSDAAVLKLTRDGGAVVNVAETNFSEDRKTVQLVLPNKFVAGDYTVKLTDGEATSEETVKLADEKVADIKIASDVAIANTNASPTALKVAYQVLNQYGEDVTADYTVAPTSSQGTAAVNTNGTIDITGTTFTLDSNVTVTLLHAETGTFASKTVKVSSAAKPATFEMKGLYNADGKTPRAGDSTTGYSVLFKAKDQYGNDLKPSELGVAGTDYVLNSSNTSVAGLGSVAGSYKKIDGVDYLEVPLTSGTFGQGTTVFNLISTTSGKSVSSTLEVPAALAVSKITLGAPDFAVGGEKFNVPFTAVDQDGNAVTDLTKLNAVNFTISNSSLTDNEVQFKKDYVTGEIYLEVDATNENIAQNKNINIIATTTNGAVAQRTVTLRADAFAASVAGIKNMEKNIAANDTVSLTAANLTFKDQYGRDMKTTPTIGATVGDYQVKVVSSNPAAVTVTNPVLDGANNTVSLKGAATKGSSNITVSLEKVTSTGPVPVSNSSFRYTANVTEAVDFASLELGTIATLNDGVTVGAGAAGFADYELVVYGVDANGNRSLLPANAVTITSTGNVLTYDNTNRKVSVTTAPTYPSATVNAVDVNFIVSAYGKSVNAVNKVSKEAQVITTLELDKDATNYDKINADTLSVAAGKTGTNVDIVTNIVNDLTAKDQYGAPIESSGLTATNVTTSDYKDAAGKTVTTLADAAVAGGSYKLTILLPNGKTASFNVKVTA